ncbi:MAG TPA: NADH-quinone oxidoreductase subunit M [Alphaproteobacteria bacterium]|nr:NADH-quinone oxidoreductase subunit M [Alphaproteobacteria bacterium]
MTTTYPILSIVTFLPLVGALLIMLFARSGDDQEGSIKLSKALALIFSVATFIASLSIFCYYDPNNSGMQLVEHYVWMPSYNIAYIKGIDGISLWFVLISTFLTPICILSAIGGVKKRVKEFMIALLVLETMMVGMFTALDFVLFYLFFEGVLIPMYLIIGVWGGEKRTYAAYKFFLYTFLGSVLMLAAIFAMVLQLGTTDMTAMMGNKFAMPMAKWLWLAFFASFAVKTPMWPFHTWLPFAHVEAPTAGSVILAGVLLKMGGYGFIRVSLQMLPEASHYFAPLVMILSLIAIVYTSLVALVQTDMKKLIAYSSVAHMGFVTLGIFSMNQAGLDGAMIVMISHAFVSGALFLCVGVVYDRLHTREIARYGGMANNMPHYALVFMIFMLGSVGLPGTSGFVGEFLSMQGAYLANSAYAFVAATGVILGAAYMLWLYRRLFYGPLEKDDVKAMPDLNCREYAMFVPLIVFVFWIGIYPSTFRNMFAPTTAKLIEDVSAPAVSAAKVKP